jgi:hypothetical protein
MTSKPDLLSPERMGVRIMHIRALIVDVGVLWAEASAAGSQSGSRGLGGGRGSGFDDIDPTYTAALSPHQRQLRNKARRAAVLVGRAEKELEDAMTELANGFLMTDDEVLARFLEKRRAAMGD